MAKVALHCGGSRFCPSASRAAPVNAGANEDARASRNTRARVRMAATTAAEGAAHETWDVFICHSGADKDAARELAGWLVRDGYKVFFDETSILPGDHITLRIAEALEHTRVLLFLMSAVSQHADWPLFELHTIWFGGILNRDGRFVPLRLDDAPLRNVLQPFKYINWKPQDRTANYADVKQAVERVRGQPAAPREQTAWKPRSWTIAPVSRFVGRTEDLKKLGALLWPAQPYDPAIRVALVGTGGMGKSTLAERAAHAYRSRFSSGWVLDGSSEATLLAGLNKVARDVGLQDVKPNDLVDVLSTRLSAVEWAGWLIIVDNVDDDTFAPHLWKFLPHIGGSVLVTSRLTHWEHDNWDMVTLDKLSMAESKAVLGADDSNAAADVLKQLDGLPLALATARAYVRTIKVGWPAYLIRLKEQQGKATLPSLRLSLEAALTRNSAVGGLLQLIQVLHPDDIPRQVLVDAFAKIQPGVNADVALALLANLSIISLTEKTVSTHRLMQAAMREVVPCMTATAEAIVEHLVAMHNQKGQTEFGLMRQLIVHLAELISWLDAQKAENTVIAKALEACADIYSAPHS